MKIYTPEEPIPAAAVTFATSVNSQQHILFTTRYDVKGYYCVKPKPKGSGDEVVQPEEEDKKDPVVQGLVQEECKRLDWAIKAVTVNLMRDWNTATALITLVCNLPEGGPIPSLPQVDQFRGGNYKYLNCEDEIRIYAGYVASPLTPITGDMLDEFPIDVDKDWETGEPTGNQLTSADRPLAPIFWGFVDRIDFDGSSRASGFQMLISCRDRMRVFADTKIISIPSLGGLLKGGKEAATGGSVTGNRNEVLADVAKAVRGCIHSVRKEDQGECWRDIITPDPDDPKNLAQLFNAYEDRDLTNKEVEQTLKDSIDPSRWLRSATHKIMDYQANPRFHMWIQRPPLAKEAAQVQWQILDRSPLDVIQQMASWEERPTDFFASHVNGDFVFGPRNLDTSGFYDSSRMYRTYFFRNWPTKGSDGRTIAPPCVNQQILAMRSFSSTLGIGTRYLIVDASNTSGTSASVIKDLQLTADSIPWSLDGTEESPRQPSIPCRTRVIFDGNLATYANESGGALLVALAASRIWSRDLNGIQMTVLGDPTWYPNEGARVYNTVLHDYGVRLEQGTLNSSAKKQQANDKASNYYANHNAPDSKKEVEGRDDITLIGKNLAPSEDNSLELSKVSDVGTFITDKTELLLPTYKTRTVTHKMSCQGRDAGYTTDVGLVGDY